MWSTDSSGNYTSLIIYGASGNSAALESLETTFHQDLNGNGTVGIHSAPAPANPSQSSAIVMGQPGNDKFVFSPNLGAEPAVHTTGVDTIQSDGFPLQEYLELTKPWNGAQTDHWQPFQSATGEPGVFGDHDRSALAHGQISDLHFGNFIIH